MEAVCPGCQKPVDPLRAPAVSVLEGRIAHFCSTGCREQFLKRSVDSAAGPSTPAKSRRTPPPAKKRDSARPVASSPAPSEARLPRPKREPDKPRRDVPRSKLITRQLIDLVLATVVVLVAAVLPFFLGKMISLITVAGAIVCFTVYRFVREKPSGAARISEFAAGPAAAALVLACVAVGLHWRSLAIAASGILLTESLGRAFELLGRRRSGILTVVEGTEPIPISTAWRDNSPLAARIRWAAQVLERLRYPLALITGAAIYYFYSGSPAEVLLSAATALVALNPRTIRMPTGDAHLAAAVSGVGRGVTVRDAHALDEVASSRIVLLIVRRSLVNEKLSLVDWKTVDGIDEESALSALAALESASEDPISAAILAYTSGRVSPVAAENIEHYPMRGLAGDSPLGFAVCGSRSLLLDRGIPTATLEPYAAIIEESGRRALFLALDGGLVAVFGIEENPIPGAEEAVKQLQRIGVEPAIVTSAEVSAAHGLGKRLGMENVVFGRSEEELGQVLAEITERGEKVIVVGRGVAFEENLRGATAAIALGDAKATQAGVDARRNDITIVPFIVELARRSRRSAVLNLTVSVSCTFLGLALAAGWFSPWVVLFAAALSYAAQAFCTWNAPYPLVERAVKRIKSLTMKLKRLIERRTTARG